MGATQSRSSLERRSQSSGLEPRPQNPTPTASNQSTQNRPPQPRPDPSLLTNGRSDVPHQHAQPPQNYPIPRQSNLTGPQRLMHGQNAHPMHPSNRPRPGPQYRYVNPHNQPHPYLQQQQPQQPQQPPRPLIDNPNLPPKSVNNNVYLVKESLQLVQDEKDPSVWKIKFKYRSTRACIVEIFFVATEHDGTSANDPAAPQRKKNHRQITTTAESPPGTRSRLEKTLRGHYVQDIDSGLVPQRYHEQSLMESVLPKNRRGPSRYPAVIRLVTLSDPSSVDKENSAEEEERGDGQKSVENPKEKVREWSGGGSSEGLGEQDKIWETLEQKHPLGGELTANIQCQTTYAEFHKEPNQDDWEIRVLKQRVWIAEVEYELKEIYGEIVQGVADDTNADDLGDGSACVICLSESRSVACFPCGHLCLCNDCANELRSQTNKCPLCRAPVTKLLDISTTAKSMKLPESHSCACHNHASTSHSQNSMDRDQENSSEETLESSFLPSPPAQDDGASSLQAKEGESSIIDAEKSLSTPENEVTRDVGNSSRDDEILSVSNSALDQGAQATGLETKPSESTSATESEESEAGFSPKGGISVAPASSGTTSAVTAPDTDDPMNDSASSGESATSSVHGDNLIRTAI